jgi:hypothetical protein
MPRRNGGLRIIIANEPRSYRDALAGVLEQRHPLDTVANVEPGQIEEVLRRWPGALVVCSEVTPVVEEMAGGWVRLGEDGEVAVSREAEVEEMAHRVGLNAVLGAIDGAGIRLAHLR